MALTYHAGWIRPQNALPQMPPSMFRWSISPNHYSSIFFGIFTCI